MARLQILELPESSNDDQPPFVLVLDEVATGPDGELLIKSSDFDNVNERIGARAVLAFEETVDIPANDTSGYLDSGSRPEFVVELAGQDPRRATGPQLAQERTDIARDMDRLAKWQQALADTLGTDRASNWDALIATAADLRNDRDEARSWARHGYEIGQKHCGWTDHGVAPGWLTQGWPPHIESCEHLKQAAEYDEALTRVRAAVARLRATTPTWEPAADLIVAAVNGEQEQP